MSPRSDADLVAAARAGDARALDSLVVRYEPRIYRFSYRLTGNADDAADVAQDTLMAMARSLGTFRGEASLATWLYAVARRAAMRKHRERIRRLGRETSLDASDGRNASEPQALDPTPEEALSARERDAVVNAALAELSPTHRGVLLLRDVEGLTAPQAARTLGIQVRAVKSRLHRARLKLRERLGPRIGAWAPETGKPGCRHVVEHFSRSLEGELSQATCAEVEAHVKRCPACKAACASLKKVLAVCRQAPAHHLPAALKRSLRRAVREVQA